MNRRRTIALLTLALSLASCASTRRAGADAAEPLDVHRKWWAGVIASDGDALRAHSSDTLVATFSSGKQYDLATLLESTRAKGRTPEMQCRNEVLHRLETSSAVATSECKGSVGQFSNTYRYLSVLTLTHEGWKVAAAQSTLVASFTKRTNATSPLGELAGSYLTPRGLSLDITAGDGFLRLREPSGTELRLEPIGPDLFEADYVAPGGWITRYTFARSASGAVTSLNVLSPGAVYTFPRKN